MRLPAQGLWLANPVATIYSSVVGMQRIGKFKKIVESACKVLRVCYTGISVGQTTKENEMTAYEAATALQNAYYMAVQEKEPFFYVSHVLGSDWAAYRSREFAGNPARYLEIVREEAEFKFGVLPFDPFDI